jgi:hypothetical protein
MRVVINLILGFIAAAIAVATVHQGIILLLKLGGLLPASSKTWSLDPYGPLGVPTIVNHMFWGGLWGILFALIWDKLPVGAWWLKGLIYGLLIVVVSNWIVLPLIRGQALFAGYDPKRLLASALILGGFGIATAVIYSVIRTEA